MATKQEQIHFVKTVYPAAKNLYNSNPNDSICPLFETAQAALEKGWRINDANGFNMFGITKGSSWKGKVKLTLTTEYFKTPNVRFTAPEKIVPPIEQLANCTYKYKVYRLFREYDSLEQCLYDHQALFRKEGYKDAWPYRHNAKEFAKRLVDNTGWKYATGPDYAKSMISIIDMVAKIVEAENL